MFESPQPNICKIRQNFSQKDHHHIGAVIMSHFPPSFLFFSFQNLQQKVSRLHYGNLYRWGIQSFETETLADET